MGCTVPEVDFTGKSCPCGEGYVCDTSRSACVPGDSDRDGGIADAGFRSDVPGSDMDRDSGEDMSASDMSEPQDIGVDMARRDMAEPQDIGVDRGIDMAAMDVGVDMPSVVNEVVPYGSVWEYYDQAEAPPTQWRSGAGLWMSGPGQLGYGDADEATILFDADPNIPSVYFRTSFELAEMPLLGLLEVIYDDGLTVWVNGTIVLQQNVPDTTHDSFALRPLPDNSQASAALAANQFVVGTNRIAVQVKQHSPTSSDVSFDLRLEVTER